MIWGSFGIPDGGDGRFSVWRRVILQAEYTQRDDDETDYLQAKLREKWRLKAQAKKNIKVKYTANEALTAMSALVTEGDYGGTELSTSVCGAGAELSNSVCGAGAELSNISMRRRRGVE